MAVPVTLQPPPVPAIYPGQSFADQMNGLADAWAFLLNPPVFRAHRAAAWTIASGHQYVPWDTVDEDTRSGWSAGSPTRYVVQVAGWYQVTTLVSLSGSGSAGQVLIPSVGVNGGSPTGSGSNGWEGVEEFVPTGSGPKASPGCWEVYGNVGDRIEIDLWFSGESGITAIDTSTAYRPRVEIVWMGV